MNSLTAFKKIMEKYGKTNTLEGTYDYFLAIKKDLEKLEQLEKIEEELGIDLITLFKALKNGIWCWNDKDHKEYFFEKPIGLTKFVMDHNNYDKKETETYRLVGVDYYELKDYGKTWSLDKNDLTKEELENDK